MLSIPRHILDKVIQELKNELPLEGCGVLIGKGRRVFEAVKLTNTDKSEVSFQIDPIEQFNLLKRIENEGLELLCIYHSHPFGNPFPSPKDVSLANFNCYYMIVWLTDTQSPSVRLFTIESGAYREEEYEIAD